MCLSNLDDSWKLPIFALCDQRKDFQHTVLTGTIPRPGWFNTVHVYEVDCKKIHDIKQTVPLLKKNHSEQSKVSEKDVRN